MNVTIKCDCGWSKTITEGEDGQTLGGTAGWYGSQHSCSHTKNGRRESISFQYGEPSDLESDMKKQL